MRLYPKLIPIMAKEIVQALLAGGDIELEPDSLEDAREDFAAILREYQAQEQAIGDEARTLLIRRDWPRAKLAEARRLVAAQRKIPVGDEGLDYVIGQMLEFLFISKNIAEVFAEDHTMRKRIATVLRRHLQVDEEVDREVRTQLKHLQEGTADWEIQYQRVQEQVRRRRGLA